METCTGKQRNIFMSKYTGPHFHGLIRKTKQKTINELKKKKSVFMVNYNKIGNNYDEVDRGVRNEVYNIHQHLYVPSIILGTYKC